MFKRRRFLIQSLSLLLGTSACFSAQEQVRGKLIIGLIAFDQGARSVEQYSRFNQILGEATQSVVELEPTFNERQALEQIRKKAWSLVFAPPGVAAIAIDQHQYIPLYPTLGQNQTRSVLVVREDHPAQSLSDLKGGVVALGQVGSATGYYLPLYDLYGLTLAEIRFSGTPRSTLEWVAQGSVDVGALAKDEFEQLRREFSSTSWRILHTSRPIPGGAVLLGPTVERNKQEQITRAMNAVTPDIAEAAGYIPNAQVPDYSYLIELIRRVQSIADRVGEQPAILFDS
jgi:phosphonate transport system substrate-binding protein